MAAPRKIGAMAGPRPPQAAPAPSGESSQASPRKTDLLSKSEDTNRSLYRICNQIKRMSSLVSAAAASGHGVDEILVHANQVCSEMLEVTGFSEVDRAQQEALRPMFLESICAMMADIARQGDDPLDPNAPYRSAMSELARSRGVTRAMDRAYPLGTDEGTAMRLTAINALTPVLLEAMAFSFFKERDELIKEVSSAMVESVNRSAAKMCPPHTNVAVRSTITQSLLNSAGKVMASIWAVSADRAIEEANELPAQLRKNRIDSMRATPAKDVCRSLMAGFNREFESLLSASMHAAADMTSVRPIDPLPGALSPRVEDRPPKNRFKQKRGFNA